MQRLIVDGARTRHNHEGRLTGRLKRLLQIDSLFIAVSGSATAAFSAPLASFLGVDEPRVLVGLGVVVLPYAGALFYGAGRQPLNPRLAILAGTLNMVWTTGSVLVALARWPPLTDQGKWSVIALAAIVGLLGALQLFTAYRLLR